MSDVVIRAEALGKKYTIGHEARSQSYVSLRDVITRGARNALRKARDMLHGRAIVEGDQIEEVWALHDLNFEVRRGDVVGVIGRNGAGKSTLLKILSRITEPSAGRVTIKGRVASLLEVGTGFHPELTGRENIFLNGAILGMGRIETRRKYGQIVEFSEIERYLDTPVKRYSSGMYMRLAFAVAAHLEPEILIVDEVLAVGDTAFQKKCLGKMKDMSTNSGRTVLFVSHNLSAVRQLCSTSILLKEGGIETSGSTSAVLDAYSRDGTVSNVPPPAAELNDLGYVERSSVETLDGRSVHAVPVGVPWRVRVVFKLKREMSEFVIGLGLTDADGMPIQTAWAEPRNLESGQYEALFIQSSITLAAGSYGIVVGLSQSERTFQQLEIGRLEISGEEAQGYYPLTSGAGVILNSMDVTIRAVRFP
jgi:lipopolysaccharide transport system ATP-binding protein